MMTDLKQLEAWFVTGSQHLEKMLSQAKPLAGLMLIDLMGIAEMGV